MKCLNRPMPMKTKAEATRFLHHVPAFPFNSDPDKLTGRNPENCSARKFYLGENVGTAQPQTTTGTFSPISRACNRLPEGNNVKTGSFSTVVCDFEPLDCFRRARSNLKRSRSYSTIFMETVLIPFHLLGEHRTDFSRW